MLDPEARLVIDRDIDRLAWPALGADKARRFHAERLVDAAAAPAAEVASVRDVVLNGPVGPLQVRVYRPHAEGVAPVLVYLHGGGWTIGSIETHDRLCRLIASDSGCAVASVEYRLAPEHKYPAALEDAYAAVVALAGSTGRAAQVDGTRLAVAGDSSGANLAAALCLLARDRGGPQLRLQVLLYPALQAAFDTPSWQEYGTGYRVSRVEMAWYWQNYLRGDGDRTDAYACPLASGDLRGLPEALIVTADCDPLRDDGETYGARLREAGVPCTTQRYLGMVHGFIGLSDSIAAGRQAIRHLAATVSASLR